MRGMLVCCGVCLSLLAGCVSAKTGALRLGVPPLSGKAPPRRAPHATPPPHGASPGPLQLGDSWYPASGKISGRWTEVVLHHSGTDVGGAARFDRFHRLGRGWDELGYHFVIGNGTDTPDGLVEIGPRWHKQKHGAHCKTPDNHYNEHGIGICLVGNFQKDSPSAAQLTSLSRLVRFLVREAHIRVDRIHTHGGITGKTACPGRHFPLSAVRGSPAVATTSAVNYPAWATRISE